VPLPEGESLDGLSLKPLLANPALQMLPTRDWALSQYPRCPQAGTDPTNYYENNKCEFVERSTIPFMGYSLRTDTYRYTEWATWNGASA
jgi:iduronate 2-sulfatase